MFYFFQVTQLMFTLLQQKLHKGEKGNKEQNKKYLHGEKRGINVRLGYKIKNRNSGIIGKNKTNKKTWINTARRVSTLSTSRQLVVHLCPEASQSDRACVCVLCVWACVCVCVCLWCVCVLQHEYLKRHRSNRRCGRRTHTHTKESKMTLQWNELLFVVLF